MAFDGPLLGGRYRLGPKLGHGSQGEIFLALDEGAKGADPKEVVVKRLKPRGTWKSFELFEREAKVLSQLRHPGVPKHLATLEEPPGTFNLVMQRAPGENLRDFVKHRRLSETELKDILVRCLEILDYLHTRTPAIVHRDIKPSNIVRAPNTGHCSLVDFGGVLDAARDKGGSTIVGTFGYMAPEQLHGQAVAATDIYALGATIVALAGGVEPEDVPRKGLRMDLEKHLPQLDPGLRAALSSMTDPDPEKRPQRARDVVSLLAKAKPRKEAKALTTKGKAALAPRRMFSDVQEPLATLLRIGVLAFGVGGWVGMAAIRLSLTLTVWIIAGLAFPRRRQITGVGKELDSMLSEGQGGFTDMMKGAMARQR
jgi:serine/threonine protein kinase